MTNAQGESEEDHDQDKQQAKKHPPRSRATNDEMKEARLRVLRRDIGMEP